MEERETEKKDQGKNIKKIQNGEKKKTVTKREGRVNSNGKQKKEENSEEKRI